MEHLSQAIFGKLPVVLARREDAKIVYINQKVCDLFGFSSLQEVKGQSAWDCFSTLLGDREYYISLFEEILNESGEVLGFELPIKSHKGKVFVLLLTLIPMEVEKKEFIVSFFCDITHYKYSYSMDTQILSHNLNNLLMVVQGYSEIGLEEIRTRKNSRKKKLERYLEQNLFACYKASTLLETSRGFFDMKKEFQYFNVAELVERVVSSFQPLMKKIKLVCNIMSQANIMRGDMVRIELVFMHLLLNAIESMPKGGLLGIRLTNDDFEGKNCIKIVISDTGEGISKENQRKIFQVSFSTKRRGSGLGLSWVHQVVSFHEGFIFVESQEGKGSTFEILFPSSMVLSMERS